MPLSSYQIRYGYDARERAKNMWSTRQKAPPGPPRYDRHIRSSGPPTWRIESQKRRGFFYVVTKGWTCTCPARQYNPNEECKHIELARIDEAGGVQPGRARVVRS